MSLHVLALMMDPWFGDLYNRKHHLTLCFAQNPSVDSCLYVEPWIPEEVITARQVSPEQYRTNSNSRVWLDRLGRQRTDTGFTWTVIPDRLQVLCPLGRLAQAPESLADHLARALPGNYITWIQSPLYAPVVQHLSPLALIYDYTDDYSTLISNPDIVRAVVAGDRYLTAHADLITTVSQALHAQKTMYRNDVVMLPNAVDLEHFTPEHRYPVPRDLAPFMNKPIVGYVGKPSRSRLDTRLLLDLARVRLDLNFVLVGPTNITQEDEDAIASQDNLHFLGLRPYDVLPAYVAHFDVCMIPHKVTDVTAFLNPIKVYEYLAMGKPVVATPIAGLDEVQSEIVFARNVKEFDATLSALLQAPTTLDMERRRQAVSNFTWSARAQAIWTLLERLIAVKLQAQHS